MSDSAWAEEWEMLRPMIVETPADALPDLADLVGRMLTAQGHPVDPTAAAGDELSEQYAQARAAADAAVAGDARTTDVADAIAQLRELYDVLARAGAG
jgi:hypothetical protein